MATKHEGVIKFHLDFVKGPAPAEEFLIELNQWRAVFRRLGLLGQDPQRYQGYGFGNLSRRLPSQGDCAFVISGTQTGHLPALRPREYATVLCCDPSTNQLRACGQIKPSSEALSHGVLYQSAPDILWVMHLHSPDIFAHRSTLKVPCTSPAAEYGTPEMASEIVKLVQKHDCSRPGLMVMSGHQDGILAYGPTAHSTGKLVLEYLRKSCKSSKITPKTLTQEDD